MEKIGAAGTFDAQLNAYVYDPSSKKSLLSLWKLNLFLIMFLRFESVEMLAERIDKYRPDFLDRRGIFLLFDSVCV